MEGRKSDWSGCWGQNYSESSERSRIQVRNSCSRIKLRLHHNWSMVTNVVGFWTWMTLLIQPLMVIFHDALWALYHLAQSLCHDCLLSDWADPPSSHPLHPSAAVCSLENIWCNRTLRNWHSWIAMFTCMCSTSFHFASSELCVVINVVFCSSPVLCFPLTSHLSCCHHFW